MKSKPWITPALMVSIKCTKLYYNNYFHVKMTDSKKVWKAIRQHFFFVYLKSRSGITPTKLVVEDAEILK